MCLITCSTLIEGMIEKRIEKERLRQEHMHGVKERRRYVVIKRLSTERKKLQAHEPPV